MDYNTFKVIENNTERINLIEQYLAFLMSNGKLDKIDSPEFQAYIKKQEVENAKKTN